MFSLTGDNDVIVYVTAGGKMECVAREDGTSRWIYAFPTVVFPMHPRGRTPVGLVAKWFGPESVFSFGPFFVDKVAAREFEMKTEGIRPLEVKGKPSSPAEIVVDEKADDLYKKMSSLGAAFALYGPLAVLALLWVFLQIGERVHFWLAVCAAAVAAVLLFFCFGAYAWYSTVLMYVAMAAVVACCIFGEALRKRYRRKKERATATPA